MITSTPAATTATPARPDGTGTGVAQTAMVYRLVRSLRDRGLGVVVISHNMADVFAVADRICVLRLGRNAGTFSTGQTTPDQVVAAITGSVEVTTGKNA